MKKSVLRTWAGPLAIIFFIVSGVLVAQFQNARNDLGVILNSDGCRFSVVVTISGEIKVAGRTVDLEELKDLSVAVHQKYPDCRAIVQEARNANTKAVVDALTVLRSSGLAVSISPSYPLSR